MSYMRLCTWWQDKLMMSATNAEPSIYAGWLDAKVFLLPQALRYPGCKILPKPVFTLIMQFIFYLDFSQFKAWLIVSALDNILMGNWPSQLGRGIYQSSQLVMHHQILRRLLISTTWKNSHFPIFTPNCHPYHLWIRTNLHMPMTQMSHETHLHHLPILPAAS